MNREAWHAAFHGSQKNWYTTERSWTEMSAEFYTLFHTHDYQMAFYLSIFHMVYLIDLHILKIIESLEKLTLIMVYVQCLVEFLFTREFVEDFCIYIIMILGSVILFFSYLCQFGITVWWPLYNEFGSVLPSAFLKRVFTRTGISSL